MKWQKRVRLVVAVFGVAFAIVVYAAIGDRQAVVPAARPVRFDPRAIIESAGAAFQQLSEARQDYVIKSERQFTYEGGATKFIGITIEVRGRAGRDFVVSGREATAGENQRELEITGDVKMSASDGLVITADRATFTEEDASVRVPGPVSFAKGGMTGTGIGMIYDKENDVLTLSEQAHVTLTDAAGNILTDFTSGSATLARQDNYLSLAGNVHVMRGEQVIEADNGVATLTENEEHVTFIELRGNARVVGGAAFDSMSARDIDLDYTDDGQLLERVVLTGSGAIGLKGQNGAPGRQFLGDSLNLAFAPDASLTSATGRTNVRLDLPGAPGSPARSVKARALDATGEPGKGLTGARFTNDVEYREEAQRGAAARLVRAQGLRIVLAGDAVTSALFNGSTTFEEEGLQASAARIQYNPAKGSLQLSGSDAGGGPRVADDQITVEATTIDVALEGRRMTAAGAVRTTLRGQGADSKLPGMLEQGEPVDVRAGALDYQGASGKATYTGMAVLSQGATAIRAETIVLDQTSGDLTASGGARSTFALDADTSQGRASEIRYRDTTRVMTYDSPVPAGPIIPPAYVAAQLSGPQGNIGAARIEVKLAEQGSTVDRLEAYTNVSVRLLDTARTATGDRMTYYASDQRYEFTGLPTTPVKLVEPGCRETTGRSMTFFKATDSLIVDGANVTRTRSGRAAGPCTPAPAR